MININLSSRNDPFLLRPAGKDYLWGGTRLRMEYNKNISMDPLAETWECSTHPDGLSIVASGKFTGCTLKKVLDMHPEYLGTHPMGKEGLPILVKLIDAKQDLSVQVHPDDEYAFRFENGQSGKTEMWYVVDAENDAKLIYGFYHNISKKQISDSLKAGNIEKYLQKVKIKKNDVFFIPAGTVHAIGAGVVIAEVQQNSNLTYRLYDYNRKDSKGMTRELHLNKALDVVNCSESLQPKQPIRLLKYRNGMAVELLCRCKYFQVERYLLNTAVSKDLVTIWTQENSFKIFLCLEGYGTIYIENGECINFIKGDCIFFPANSTGVKFNGKAKFIGVNC